MSFAKTSLRKGSSLKTTVYGSFKGVDFSVDPSLVGGNRSPYALNLISDTGGLPEKRLGWRTIALVDYPVNGMFYTEIDGRKYFIIHGGRKIFKLNDDGTTKLLKEGISNSKSVAFFMHDGENGGLYILTGGEYLVFDGFTVENVSDNAYVPNILATCDPSGAGAVIEPINLLGKKRMQSYIGNDTAKTYQLSALHIESVDKVQVLNSVGLKITLDPKSDYSVDLQNGTVTFKTTYNRLVAGQDNIFITFSKEINGYNQRIEKCNVGAVYGLNKSDKLFISGNKSHNGKVWHSYTGKPNYFPDTYYVVAGNEENCVMGFARLGKYLLIVKEENQQDSTIFQLWGEKNNDRTVSYIVEQGIAGVGAICTHAFDNLLDEPLFLSRRGIMAIYNNTVSLERTIKNRSYFIDSVLTKEKGLENAVGVEWNGYFLLAVNGRCYVLDGRNKSYRHNQTEMIGDFIYECYLWDNFPAVCFLSKDGDLYFGTSRGKICRLNTDITSNKRFNDDGEAVCAIWSTKNDDDGASFLYKSMSKKGCSVTIKPYLRSSCNIYFKKDGEAENFIRSHLMDIFSWDNMDFERFTFNTNESPQDVYLKKKVKKYKRLQLIIKNEGKDEGFGILQITKTYKVKSYSKS